MYSRHKFGHPFGKDSYIAGQLSSTTAILASETDTTSYYVGGTFVLSGGPFTGLSFSADDDDDDDDDDAMSASFGAQYSETSGAGLGTWKFCLFPSSIAPWWRMPS